MNIALVLIIPLLVLTPLTTSSPLILSIKVSYSIFILFFLLTSSINSLDAINLSFLTKIVTDEVILDK